ncbi:MAG: hypothetical protein EOO13_00430 [Chitinophagaceae bacterium]|nr:MAG: hypothetical protein EOO13_00430 [Chitinophagaceae bacterium]
MLYSAISRLSIKDKDYFDSKTRLIAELGYIKDTLSDDIPAYLKKIYEQTADTSMFQNEAIIALARLKTAVSFKVLKELMLQDPPIFENNGDYSSFFSHFYDSLQLSASLFPQLLQLSTLNDYKENITGLLVTLVDSGYIKAKDYESYFPGIYIDGKVALRKQQAKEEKQLQEELKKEDEEDDEPAREYSRDDDYSLNDYAVLLMPFYETNKNVQQFFNRLLVSKDDNVRMNAAVLFLRNNKNIPDSILLKLAADDKYRATLYDKLEWAGRLDKFPKAYANQLALARSFLFLQNEYDKMDSLVFIKKMTTSIKSKTGQVYFFKYRIKKTDDWKIAFSGLQPLNEKELSSNDELTSLTDKKLLKDQPLDEQLNKELKKQVFGFYNSGKNFYGSDDYRQYNYGND